MSSTMHEGKVYNNSDIEALLILCKNSSSANGWYDNYSEVRGPWNRWFTVSGGEQPERPDSIADSNKDVAFCAAAMNHLEPLLEHIKRLQKQLDMHEIDIMVCNHE